MPLFGAAVIWFFVLPESLPQSWGLWLKQMPTRAVLYRGDRDRASCPRAEPIQNPCGVTPLAARTETRRHRARIDDGADLSLCAATDGISQHAAAASLRVSRHHQRHVRRHLHGLIELTGEARAMQEFSFSVFRSFSPPRRCCSRRQLSVRPSSPCAFLERQWRPRLYYREVSQRCFANFDFDVIRRSPGYLFFDGHDLHADTDGLASLGGLAFGR